MAAILSPVVHWSVSAWLTARSPEISPSRKARRPWWSPGKLTERLHDFMIRSSGFHPRFVAKGRFEAYMKAISVRLALPDEVGLFGAAAAAFRDDHSWR